MHASNWWRAASGVRERFTTLMEALHEQVQRVVARQAEQRKDDRRCRCTNFRCTTAVACMSTLAGHALSGTFRIPCRHRVGRKVMPGRDEAYMSVSFSKVSKLHGGLVNRQSESSVGRHSAGEWPCRAGDRRMSLGGSDGQCSLREARTGVV